MKALTWFQGARMIPSIADATLVLGGTHLIREFLCVALSRQEQSELTVVAPFLDATILTDFSDIVTSSARRISLTVITTPESARSEAFEALRAHPWRSCRCAARRGLHAKMYVSRPLSESPIALVGSHNFTSAASSSNVEVGFMLLGSEPCARELIHSLEAYVAHVLQASRLQYDSLDPRFARVGAA